jgi:hypothetical protein
MIVIAAHPVRGERILVSASISMVPTRGENLDMTTHQKFKLIKHILALLALAVAAAAISGTALVQSARADILELRNGQIVQGRFLGGSPLNIRFEVDGKEQVFATKDVLNIGFSEPGDASDDAPPPAPPPPPPNQDASSAQPAPPPDSGPPPEPAAPPTADAAPNSSAQQSPPPGAPVITIPAGTSVLIRMIDEVDSSTSKIGDPFQASLDSPLMVGDTIVAPKGADVFGELQQVKSAGKISGAPQLTLALTGIRIRGKMVPVDSTTYELAGKSRGAQSAERIGGGAVAGAIIGGIIGGGRGAAVGATLGAGTGTAVQVMTHGDRLNIPSETLLEFKLGHDVSAPLAGLSN